MANLGARVHNLDKIVFINGQVPASTQSPGASRRYCIQASPFLQSAIGDFESREQLRMQRASCPVVGEDCAMLSLQFVNAIPDSCPSPHQPEGSATPGSESSRRPTPRTLRTPVLKTRQEREATASPRPGSRPDSRPVSAEATSRWREGMAGFTRRHVSSRGRTNADTQPVEKALVLTVVGAANLPNMGHVGLNDPFCVITPLGGKQVRHAVPWA